MGECTVIPCWGHGYRQIPGLADQPARPALHTLSPREDLCQTNIINKVDGAQGLTQGWPLASTHTSTHRVVSMHLPGSAGREGIVCAVGFRLSGDILGFGVGGS